MRSIQSLSAAANITDTSTTQINEFQGTKFADDILKYAEDFRFLQQVVNVDTSILNTKDASARLFVTTSHLDVTAAHTEGAERTYTEITNLDSVTVTPTWDLGAIAISKEIVKTCAVDLIELAKYMIAQDGEKKVETAIATAVITGTNNSVFGGDATTYQSLEPGDTITPDLVKNARGLIRADDGKPKVLAINPEQETDLIKYSDFNAVEYGGREIVLNGEIGKFVGLKVITSNNVPAKDSGDSWGADGHLCFILGQNDVGQWGQTLVWKEKLTYDYEYLKRFVNHYIYRDACYAVGLLQQNLNCLIFVTDT